MSISRTDLARLKFAFQDAVIRDGKLTATDLRVSWLLLSTHLNRHDLLAWPSAETMAAVLDIHETTVWRSINRLTKRGWWTKVSGGGRGRSNRYRPSFERVAAALGFSSETLASVQRNPSTGAAKTLASVQGEPLEEPFKEPRNKISQNDGVQTNHQLARQGDGANGENLSPREISPERRETILYYRRQERDRRSIRFSEITDNERHLADEILAAENEPTDATH